MNAQDANLVPHGELRNSPLIHGHPTGQGCFDFEIDVVPLLATHPTGRCRLSGFQHLKHAVLVRTETRGRKGCVGPQVQNR